VGASRLSRYPVPPDGNGASRRQARFYVGDHAINTLIHHGRSLDAILAELDPCVAGVGGQPPGFGELFDGEVNADDRPDGPVSWAA
jgi:hypothetical protein